MRRGKDLHCDSDPNWSNGWLDDSRHKFFLLVRDKTYSLFILHVPFLVDIFLT